MAIKQVKQLMRTPVGINNYSGDTFRCFTKGDDLSFEYNIKDGNGAPIDITNYDLTITISAALNDSILGCKDSIVNNHVINIPITDAVNGIFAGSITGEQTAIMPAGIAYAVAKYTTAPNDADPYNIIPGKSHIIDMCQLEIYQNVACY